MAPQLHPLLHPDHRGVLTTPFSRARRGLFYQKTA